MNKYLVIQILVFISCGFFGLIYPPMFKLTPFLSIIIGFRYLSYSSLFKKEILLSLLLLCISAYVCNIFRDQDLSDTFTTDNYYSFFGLLLYFAFLQIRPSYKDIERVILISYLVFLFIYILQYFYYPKEIVLLIVNNKVENRFRIMGQIINSLGFFYCLCKYYNTKQLRYAFLVFLGLIVVFMLSFRMMLGAICLVSLISYIHVNGLFVKKVAILSVALFFLLLVLSEIPIVMNSINRMMEANAAETYTNADYIRWVSLDYFINDHFSNWYEILFGTGMPGRFSSYGKMMQVDTQTDVNTLIHAWADWGLLGLCWVSGPLFVMTLLYMWCKCIKISWKLKVKYRYISYWLIFLLFISINNIEIFRLGSFGFHAMILYVITILNEKACFKNECKKQVNC